MSLVINATFVAFVMAGCATINQPPSPHGMVPEFVTHDDRLINMNEEVPRFGGMYYDENGDLVVFLVGLEQTQRLEPASKRQEALRARKHQVEQALLKVFGNNILAPRIAPRQEAAKRPEIHLRPAQYSIIDLANWRPSIASAFDIQGVVFTDLDEAKNRLTIGVENDEAKDQILRHLESQSVPLDAINVELVAPIKRLADLDDRKRPLVGGLRMTSSFFSCTLGINAYRAKAGRWVKGFVTNSHCTNVMGSVTSELFFQNAPPSPASDDHVNYIGYEIIDSPFISSRSPFICPKNKRCRFSDTAFIQYQSGAGSDLGKIARPTFENEGIIVIDSADPEFEIVGEEHHPVSGTPLHKVGQTTGWSSGRIANTCCDVGQTGTDFLFKCQYRVKRNPWDSHTMAGPGDSGSPVFLRHGTFRNPNVTLYGVLWGGDGDEHFTFSSIAEIEKPGELGPLLTFGPPPSSPPDFDPAPVDITEPVPECDICEKPPVLP